MSQENVDRLKEGIEGFNRGDLAGVFRYYHPEIQFEHRLVELQVDVTGVDAVRDWFVEAAQIFDLGQSTATTSVIWATGCWRWGRFEPSGRRAGLR